MRLICDKQQFRDILRERREMGGDRFDEVWDGVYVMSPLADIEHQALCGAMTVAFTGALSRVEEVVVLPGCNVSDRTENWRKNYRCPDVVVFLPGNPGRSMGAYWLGGPDFAVEVLSPRDRARKKFDFYAKIGVRELLLVDRKRWRLELYRLADGSLNLVGVVDVGSTEPLTSHLLPISLRMIPGEGRPLIEIIQVEDGRRWTA